MAINLGNDSSKLLDPLHFLQVNRLNCPNEQGGVVLGNGSYSWTKEGTILSKKVKDSITPENLILDIFASLARAVDWSVHLVEKNKSQFELYGDLDGICSRISVLYIIMQNRLHLFRTDLFEEIDSPSRKAQWLDKQIRPFCKDLNRYIKRYSDILGSDKNIPPYVLRDLEPVFASCAGCALRFQCLYVFKEVFSIFVPELIFSGNKDTILYEIYGTNIENIRKIIDGFLIQNGDMAGWPCSTSHKDEIDVYITASMINLLVGWQRYLDDLHLKHDLSMNSEIFKKCVNAIRKLQIVNKEKKNRELVGDDIDISGSWKEFYWGEYLVNRIKATANIAKILNNLGGSKETIKSAKTFIDRTFGNAPFCVDLVSYRDTISSTVSDISGTVAALDFYLNIGTAFDIDPRDVTILIKIRWLLDQQRRDGAWPILSKELLNKYMETPYIRDNLRIPDGYDKNNKSLPNTIGAMKALTTFLNVYIKD